MPHATTSSLGIQAIILCGPGEGLNPFNSSPKDFPKALIPIANRPMVWYPLEWCHRAAVSNITLVTPPECAAALEAALSQNPYLTSLGAASRTTVLSPEDLDLTTGTAEIFRLPEVQDAITGDFVVLPCDLVCEVGGRALWEAWTLTQPPLLDTVAPQKQQKGGMGVWYETKDASENGVGVKKEETDFLATTSRETASLTSGPIESHIRHVALSMPTDTLNDELQEKENLRVRTQLLRKKGKVRMQVKTRDAHMYFMPYWSKHYLAHNESFESLGEDGIGYWAKATWQTGLDKKLGMDEALRPVKRRKSDSGASITTALEDLDLDALSSTTVGDLSLEDDSPEPTFASRVPQDEASSPIDPREPAAVPLPPMLGYVHPSLYVPSDGTSNSQQGGPKQKQQPKGVQQKPQAPTEPPSQLIRRVDTVKLLLSASLYLARLPSILSALSDRPPTSAHPYCHPDAVHPTTTIPSQSTIDQKTVLIDANCTLQPKITIRDTVIAANCSIASGCRLHGCLVMEGVVIEERVVLSGCVIGRRCKVGSGSDLKDCSLQDGYVVAEGTSTKGEVLAGFDEGAGLEDEEEGEDEDEDGEGLDLGAV